MTQENENLELVIEGEGEFDFPDEIEPIAIELVPDEDVTGVDDAIETSLPEETEEKITEMNQVFIVASELETKYKDENEVETNSDIKELYELADLDCVEVIFNTTHHPSTANKTALDTILKLIHEKYSETFGNVVGKITTITKDLMEANESLPKGDLELIEDIRSRSNSLQTNYIPKDGSIMNVFTTPLSDFRDMLERDYAVPPKFEVVYKLCNDVLDSKDKTFADISCFLEVLYKDWLSSVEKLKNISIFLEEDFDGSFRSKLDILNLRDRLDAIAINTGRVSEVYKTCPDGNIFELIRDVMFNEL